MPDSLLSLRAAATGPGPIEKDRFQRAPISALLAAMLLATGCGLFPKKQVRTYVPPPVQHPAPPPLKLADGEPPRLELQTAEVDLSSMAPVIVFTAPPAPPPPVRTRPPVVTIPKPPPAPAAPESAPPPKIALMLPAEELRNYNRELDSILEQDQKALEALARRNLNADQRDRMAAIRELLGQARQEREQDLVTAVDLARRADTLTKDLLDRQP